jgi:hypothetical protein
LSSILSANKNINVIIDVLVYVVLVKKFPRINYLFTDIDKN